MADGGKWMAKAIGIERRSTEQEVHHASQFVGFAREVHSTVDEGLVRQIARRHHLSLSFVSRLSKRRRGAGTLKPAMHGGGALPALGLAGRLTLGRLVAGRKTPRWTGFAAAAASDAARRRSGGPCVRMGPTREKRSPRADERGRPDVERKRRSFRGEMRPIKPRRLHLVDETETNAAMTRIYGRAGRRLGAGKWESFTAAAALGVDRASALLVAPGAVDATAFDPYVEQVPAPVLRPAEAVVWDNLRSHQQDRAAARPVRKAGARLVSLPPYSPDYRATVVEDQSPPPTCGGTPEGTRPRRR